MVLEQYLSTSQSQSLCQAISRKYESLQNEALYDVAMMLQEGMTFEKVMACVSADMLCWNHSKFKEVVDAQKEIFSYIENPYEVIDGMFNCPKCGSKKTISYSKQTRSADEGMSTFVFCANKECRHRWMYRG